MGAHVGQPCLDLGDPVRIGRCLGLFEQACALDVGGEYDLGQCFRAARRFLRDRADLQAAPDHDRAALGRGLAPDHPE